MRLPFAGNLSFAHLRGLGRANSSEAAHDLRDANASAAAEEEDMEGGVEEEENDEEASAAGADKKKSKKSKKGKDGDDDDDDDAGEDDGDGDENDDDASDDEDDDVEDDGDKDEAKGSKKKGAKASAKGKAKADFKRGRKAERERIGRILGSEAASANIELAAKLACTSGMSSASAITILKETPAARGGRLGQRMQTSKIPDVRPGSPDAPSGSAAVAASWDAAMKDFK